MPGKLEGKGPEDLLDLLDDHLHDQHGERWVRNYQTPQRVASFTDVCVEVVKRIGQGSEGWKTLYPYMNGVLATAKFGGTPRLITELEGLGLTVEQLVSTRARLIEKCVVL